MILRSKQLTCPFDGADLSDVLPVREKNKRFDRACTQDPAQIAAVKQFLRVSGMGSGDHVHAASLTFREGCLVIGRADLITNNQLRRHAPQRPAHSG